MGVTVLVEQVQADKVIKVAWVRKDPSTIPVEAEVPVLLDRTHVQHPMVGVVTVALDDTSKLSLHTVMEAGLLVEVEVRCTIHAAAVKQKAQEVAEETQEHVEHTMEITPKLELVVVGEEEILNLVVEAEEE